MDSRVYFSLRIVSSVLFEHYLYLCWVNTCCFSSVVFLAQVIVPQLFDFDTPTSAAILCHCLFILKFCITDVCSFLLTCWKKSRPKFKIIIRTNERMQSIKLVTYAIPGYVLPICSKNFLLYYEVVILIP